MFRGGASAHIGKEILEGVDPPFTNGDASSFPEMLLAFMGVPAPSFHLDPRNIFGYFGQSMRSSTYSRATHCNQRFIGTHN
jgi:hypothetical protein